AGPILRLQGAPATSRLYGNVPRPPGRAVAPGVGILHRCALILAPGRVERDETQSSSQSTSWPSLDVGPLRRARGGLLDLGLGVGTGVWRMRGSGWWFAAEALLVVGVLATALWVYGGAAGRLIYVPDEGDYISTARYCG